MTGAPKARSGIGGFTMGPRRPAGTIDATYRLPLLMDMGGLILGDVGNR